jgi:hypothetical protein
MPPLSDLAERHPYVCAFGLFLASRVVVFLGVAFADLVVAPQVGPGFWQAGEAWYHRLLRWDSGWYMRIAARGYAGDANPAVETPIAFFPLLPMLARGLSALTGLRIIDSLLLVANAGGLAAVMLLVALVRHAHGAPVAVRAAALLAFLPSSVFLSSAYSEPLALAFCIGALLALQNGWFAAAAMASALATATRSASVALVPVLAGYVLLASRLAPLLRLSTAAALALAAAGGLLAFMAWQWWVFGDAFAFAKAQQAWSGQESLSQRLMRGLTLAPVRQWQMPGALYFIGFVALVAIGARRIAWWLTAYATLVLAIAYVTAGTGIAGLSSMPRFVLMAFPAFIVAALLLEGRPRLTALVIGLGAIGLFWTTELFSQWHWAG